LPLAAQREHRLMQRAVGSRPAQSASTWHAAHVVIVEHTGLLCWPPMHNPAGLCGQGVAMAVRQPSSCFVHPCAEPAGAHLALPRCFLQMPEQQAPGSARKHLTPVTRQGAGSAAAPFRQRPATATNPATVRTASRRVRSRRMTASNAFPSMLRAPIRLPLSEPLARPTAMERARRKRC
jgi:hypothetical protein